MRAVQMAEREKGSDQQVELGKEVFLSNFFNIYLEKIMPDALEELGGKVRVHGRYRSGICR